MKAAIGADSGAEPRPSKTPSGLPKAPDPVVRSSPVEVASRPQKRTPLRRVAAGFIVAAGFVAVSAVIVLAVGRSNPAGKDFIEYWAAEQQLAHHANPYDRDAVLRIERTAGFDRDRPEFWYSPPPTLVLALPLGFVSARTGMVLWTLVQFACLALSLGLLWQIHGHPNTLLYLLGFLFAPAVICIGAGQISLLLLLGVTLFLRFYDSAPLVAGAALLPCVLKPHLCLPFAVALLLWIVVRKAWWIAAGFAAALTAGDLVALSFDPGAWRQYSQLMRSDTRVLQEFIPTLSECFRYVIDRDAVGLRFVPVAAACAWAAWYFWPRRARWNWMEQGMMVLLVSALCRPYGWIFDESIVLPALMTSVVSSRPSGRLLVPTAIAAGAALVEAQAGAGVMSAAYLWTSPAWLICYLLATGWRDHRPGEEISQ